MYSFGSKIKNRLPGGEVLDKNSINTTNSAQQMYGYIDS